MNISRTKASLRHWRPLVGFLPWVLVGTIATMAMALVLICLPWLPGMKERDMPWAVAIIAVILGGGMLGLLVPAQIRALLREATGGYAVESDASGVTITYRGFGVFGARKFPWDSISGIGLDSVGFPPCEVIRIEPHEGYGYSFGAFFDAGARIEILKGIRSARMALNHKYEENA